MKYGAPIYDESGFPVELNGKLKVRDKVLWLGRKVGSCSDDSKFMVNEPYPVTMIHPSNFDVELEQYIDGEHITIRAGESEYQVIE